MQKSVSVVVLVVRNWTELGHLDHGFDDEDLYNGGDDGVDNADDTTYQQSEYLSGPDILHGTHPDTPDVSWTQNITVGLNNALYTFLSRDLREEP